MSSNFYYSHCTGGQGYSCPPSGSAFAPDTVLRCAAIHDKAPGPWPRPGAQVSANLPARSTRRQVPEIRAGGSVGWVSSTRLQSRHLAEVSPLFTATVHTEQATRVRVLFAPNSLHTGLSGALRRGMLSLILEGRRIAFSGAIRGRRKVRTPKGAMPRNWPGRSSARYTREATL